jgi:hypothetical protein
MQAKDQLTGTPLTTILPAAGLTAEELGTLKHKMLTGGHKFFEKAAALGDAALYLRRAGQLAPGSASWKLLWDQREPLVRAMDELYEIMAEIETLREPVSA